MRPSRSRVAATTIIGLFVAAACSSSTTIPVVTSAPPTTPPTASSTSSRDATPRVIDLTEILDIATVDRFETFGDEPIRLEQVWSPNDTGLGGTCGQTSVPWLECLNLADWYLLPVADGAGCPVTRSVDCYDGPMLEIVYEPGVTERLGLGDGPVDVVGHFGHPASEDCRPENRDRCRDRFVVTAIDQAGS